MIAVVADAFRHPWIAFGCGFLSALILVGIVGVFFVGASANDAVLILVPLGGMTYFIFDPDAFNAFLDWLMQLL